jgi:hypothetical protein
MSLGFAEVLVEQQASFGWMGGYFRMQSPIMPVAVPHLAPAAAP